MAAFTGNLLYTGKAVNNENLVVQEHKMTAQALANADTLDLSVPSGVDKDMVPVAIMCYSNASPRVLQTAYAITNYNKTTGVLRITATGAVAQNSTFVILWAPCTTN